MRNGKRTPILLALAGMLASLVTFVSPGTAVAAESIPELQWPAVKTSRYTWNTITSSTGVTTACTDDNGTFKNLKTYNSSGQVVRDLDASQSVDGVTNCIYSPVVAKNGDLYGKPYGKNASGSWMYNTNLVAYNGNTVKWKYDTGCTAQASSPVVGADGNIYAISGTNGTRLIGLTPEVEPGTSQPKKVLDLPLSGYGLCGAELYATKDGIGYMKEMRAYLYSYTGKALGTTPSGVYIDRVEQISAVGRVFYPVYVGSGSTASIKIVAYNLNTDRADWTTLESTFGQNPQFKNAYSTPDGGVVVLVRRLKVVAGAPTSERVYALVRLNAFGQKFWEKDLPNQDTSGNAWGNTYVGVDVNGNVTVTRAGSLQTNDPYSSTMPAISIGVFDGNGSVVYDKIMRGNLDKASGGVNGYTLGGQGYSDPTSGPNTLYFLSTCNGTCGEYLLTKLYAVKIPGLGMDYPRGAVLAVPPLKPYVALGDSFSSGQGAGVYDTDTVTSTNKCYKSYHGYGRILGRDTSSPLMLTNFAACGGSITDNIDTNTTYPGITQKQDQALSSNTKVVSITIGGNDIGFAGAVTECVKASVGLGNCTTAIADARSQLQSLPTKLNRVYADVLSKTSSQNGGVNAQIYVLGYAPLLSASAPDCVINDFPFGGDNKTAAILLLNDLNKAISDAVTAASNPRIQYVNPVGTNSPFIGHSLCTAEPYFNGITGPDIGESFHPNPKGQKAYADLLAQYVLAS